jgi:hypothetical protein
MPPSDQMGNGTLDNCKKPVRVDGMEGKNTELLSCSQGQVVYNNMHERVQVGRGGYERVQWVCHR